MSLNAEPEENDYLSVLLEEIVDNRPNLWYYGDGNWFQFANSIAYKKDDKGADHGKILQEINIRLAGFGGNVPDEDFTERTEKTVKQFQKDYMKIDPTGVVDSATLEAIDEFSEKYDISTTNWTDIKCSCSTKGKTVKNKLRAKTEENKCDGFGDGTGKGKHRSGKPKTEAFSIYEYPGLHRSLLFGIKALKFYLSEQETYKINFINSGYRCRFKNYFTTNHQGKAIDLKFYKGSWEIKGAQKKNLVELRKIRDDFYIDKLGAQKNWTNSNKYSIEPIDLLYKANKKIRYDHTFSWIHMDVRKFDQVYLKDKFFCKNSKSLNKEKMTEITN